MIQLWISMLAILSLAAMGSGSVLSLQSPAILHTSPRVSPIVDRKSPIVNPPLSLSPIVDRQSSGVNQKSPAKTRTRARAASPVRFIWPTSGRKIVERYGERRNPRTGTVTINPGINIAAATGSAVVASEDGTVSLVSWLPSYGTIVIVEHQESYRTVYGSLARATVKRGARVRSGERVGTAGGGMVHFEVWKGETRMDPLKVLKKK